MFCTWEYVCFSIEKMLIFQNILNNFLYLCKFFKCFYNIHVKIENIFYVLIKKMQLVWSMIEKKNELIID